MQAVSKSMLHTQEFSDGHEASPNPDKYTHQQDQGAYLVNEWCKLQ